MDVVSKLTLSTVQGKVMVSMVPISQVGRLRLRFD